MGVVVRQKKKGRGQPWWVFITHHGKRTSRRVGDKAAALKVAAVIEAKLKLGEFDLEFHKCGNRFQDDRLKELPVAFYTLPIPDHIGAAFAKGQGITFTTYYKALMERRHHGSYGRVPCVPQKAVGKKQGLRQL